MDDIVMMLQKVSRDNMEAAVPSDIVVGTVTSESPLEITLDQKLILNAKQILLTRNVIDHFVDITPEGGTRREYKIHNKLLLGEQVIMIRNKGGQLYVALDRVVNS